MYLKRKLLVLMLLIAGFSMLYAQESGAIFNDEGKDIGKLKHTWRAQWITHPKASTLDYGVFNFRKRFTLNEVPEKLIVHVSADNRYRFYVNGAQVAFGPAVGDINNYRYESVDVAKYLNKGENVFAAEVVNFGEYRRGAQQTFQTAFILQAESEEPDLNTGSSLWRVKKNEAYECIPFTSDSLKSYYCAGPGDLVDAKKYPWEWKETSFDDSQWEQPKLGTVEFAVGRGFLYGSTWFLVPRQIPDLEESIRRFQLIDRVTPEMEYNNFIEEGKTTTIPANTKVSFLLDYEEHTTGFPELLISKGKNARIKITYSEALFLKALPQTETVAHFSAIDLKANRNEIEDKEIQGYYDIILADGGLNRKFKPLGRKTFRYVQLDIETAEQELLLNDYYHVYTVYPFEEKAKFITDDQELNKIWDAAWLTLRNSSAETFFDPYYEQLQYIGDTRVEALVSIYVSGDDALMRKAIQQFDDSRLPNGLTQSRYPSYIVQVIPPFSLLWVGMIHDYMSYRQDAEFVEKFVPGIKSVLDWFIRNMDDTGMVTNLEWWNFTDWSAGFLNGIPPGADNGYSANVNLQLVYALQNAVEIFNYLGLEDEAKKYNELREKVQTVTWKTCFSEDRNLIAETPALEVYSQHTNIWGILTNTIPEENQKQIMQNILDDESLMQATIYFRFYLFRALQKAGMGDAYLNLLKPWKNMIAKGMTTFGETDDVSRSDCHGWSASPCFDYLHTVAGIYPTAPEFRSLTIEPNFGYLNTFQVEFPHPQGNLVIELEKRKSKVKGEIIIPEGIEAFFKWQGKIHHLKNGKNEIEF